MSQSIRKTDENTATLWHLLSVLFDEHVLVREIAPGEYEVAVAPVREARSRRPPRGGPADAQTGTGAALT